MLLLLAYRLGRLSRREYSGFALQIGQRERFALQHLLEQGIELRFVYRQIVGHEKILPKGELWNKFGLNALTQF